MSSSVPFFARRKLASTTSPLELGKIRAALTALDIPFRIGQSDITPPLGPNGLLPLNRNAPTPAYEYTVYVHRDDLELALSALAGSVD